MSAKTGAGLDELRAALGRAADGVEQRAADRPDAPLRRPRRSRCAGSARSSTGTLWSGSIGAGDELRARAGRAATCACGASQVHDRDGRARGGRASGSRSACPGSSAARSGAATRSSRRGAYPVSYRLDVVLEELEPIADGARVQVHHGTAHVAARVVRVGRAVRAAAARRAGRRRARRPRRPARRDDARRRTRARPGAAATPRPGADGARSSAGDIAATIHAPVPRRLAAARARRRASSGVERAGPGCSRARGSTSLEQELRARIDAADPLDPGVPPPAGALGGRRRSRCSRSSGAARSSTCRAPSRSLGGRERRGASALERELAERRRRTRRRSRTPSSPRFLEASGAARPARRRARDRRRRLRAWRGTFCSQECARRGRDHARPLPRPPRRRPARRAAPARALRPGRAHAPRRRPACAPPGRA